MLTAVIINLSVSETLQFSLYLCISVSVSFLIIQNLPSIAVRGHPRYHAEQSFAFSAFPTTFFVLGICRGNVFSLMLAQVKQWKIDKQNAAPENGDGKCHNFKRKWHPYTLSKGKLKVWSEPEYPFCTWQTDKTRQDNLEIRLRNI